MIPRRGLLNFGGQGAGAIALALLLAGCGGGGTNSAPAPIPGSPASAPTPAPTPTATPAAVFDTAEYRRSDGPSLHGAIAAWQLGATGKGVSIGIVDTGIDPDNPEFRNRISPSSGDVAGSRGLSDGGGHGTMVALIAAAARNDVGIVGMAWESTIISLRADRPGTCSEGSDGYEGCRFNGPDIARGVDRAVQAGAKVINLSLGGSSSGTDLAEAVSRAAAADVVVVVGAGNDGPDASSPDGFAVALRQAGNGNVIIAGSINEAGQVSDFSNRAGSEASSYLMALGEGVCCVYENGAVKTVVENGQTLAYIVSGTSFSAPQISGAATLLRQAFPNLTAREAVDLLLRTARDAGDAGQDAIYGRGILDIAKAFAPQGTTTLAGGTSALALGDDVIMGSPAMGDAAARTAPLQTVMLDSYQRAYGVDLAPGMHGARVRPRLGPALLGQMRNVSGGAGQVSLAFSVDGPGARRLNALTQPLHLATSEERGARLLAAQLTAKVAPRLDVAFGFGRGAQGLASQLQGAGGPAYFVAAAPLADAGFTQGDETAAAVRRRLGGWNVTASAESGSVLADGYERGGLPDRSAFDSRNRYSRFGLSLDRNWSGLTATLGLSVMAEDGTLLGGRVNPALGASGADSLFLDASAWWRFAPQWQAGAAWRQGRSTARAGGTVASGSTLASNAWSLDLVRSSVFAVNDSLAFRLSQPLRVSSGGLKLLLPTSYDYATRSVENSLRDISLAPRGRELDAELAWQGPVGMGMGSASLFLRRDPGHYAGSPDEHGFALSWRGEF